MQQKQQASSDSRLCSCPLLQLPDEASACARCLQSAWAGLLLTPQCMLCCFLEVLLLLSNSPLYRRHQRWLSTYTWAQPVITRFVVITHEAYAMHKVRVHGCMPAGCG